MNQRACYAAPLLWILILSADTTTLAGANLPERLQPSAPRINVRIYNYSRLSRAPLSSAVKVAGRILRLSGIETNWIECDIPTPSVARNPRCVDKAGAVDLVVRILPHEMAEFRSHNELGVAFLPSGTGFGQQVSVFYNRVEEHAIRWEGSEGLLLGHVITHELGHLLLGANSHSSSGIMNPGWTSNTIEKALHGTLGFHAQESQQMRRQVARRMRFVAR